jgi:hypothetical protein
MPIAEIRRFTWGAFDLDVPAIRNHPRNPSTSDRPGHRMAATAPADSYDVELDTELLHADPVYAVIRARELLSSPASLSGIACSSLDLVRAELRLTGDPTGMVRVRLELSEAIPFPYSPWPAQPDDAISFEKALFKAQQVLEPVAVYADLIDENPRWWWFGTRQIGCHGAAVRKRDGHAQEFGTGVDEPLEAQLRAFDEA